MFRIIFSAVLLVVLAVLVVFNLDSTSTVNLFGREFENVSVVAIGLVSFVAGVVYSFIIYLGNYIARGRRDRLSKRERTVKEKEKAEKKQKKRGDAAPALMPGSGGDTAPQQGASESDRTSGDGAVPSAGAAADTGRSGSGGLLGRRRKKKQG